MTLETALFTGELDAVIACVYENERPLQGLAGTLDWRFNSEISRFLKMGVISGRAGEFAYVPTQKNGSTYHLLLIGGGKSAFPGHRHALPASSVEALEKNLKLLNLKNIGADKNDLIEFHKKTVRLFE